MLWLNQVEEKLRCLNPDPSLVLNIDETPVNSIPSNAAVFIPEESATIPLPHHLVKRRTQ